MDWKIVETNQLAPQDVDRQGNKLLIGNGNLGYRGTLEEYTSAEKTATILAGLYDQAGDQWREPVNLPNGGFVQVSCDGQPLHALTGRVLDHRQGIDMRSATHERETTFEAPGGARVTLRSRRFASLARRQLICMEYSLSTDRECSLELLSGIDGQVWDINGPHLLGLQTGEQDGILSINAVTGQNTIPVAVAEAVLLPPGVTLPPSETSPGPKILRHLRLRLQGEFTFTKIIAHCSGLESPHPLQAARELCAAAAQLGFEALLDEHRSLWEERWAACDIQVEGDEPAQQALRFSMYHLLSIVPAHTPKASIPARGMSGQMYKGAIFWDTEIFMLPFFTHTFPGLARSLLLYRRHTLDGARRKAQEYGYRGAFYAWESQDTGDDACTLFNVTDVFTNRPMRTYFRDKQLHISADIAYAFWQYYTITGDASIWRDGGAEVVMECARFYLSCTYYNPGKRRYEILDVTGPDEYHERVHNNAFTNRLARHSLEICLRVCDHLRTQFPKYFDDLMLSLDFETDLALIADLARYMYQPDAVPAGAIIPQFDGYPALENLPLKDLLARKLHPHEYLGGGNGLATTTQIIKQADVILTIFLFGERYPLVTRAANWDFYEPRTEHGSSLSACSYSIVAAQIGRVDWAYRYFMKTATIDLTGEGKQYVGTLYVGGTHPAGNGGAWMSAVFGLCGLRADGDTLSIDPRLPSHWTRVTLPLVLRGQSLKVSLTHAEVSVTPAAAGGEPLFIRVDGVNHPLQAGQSLRLPLPAAQPAQAPA